MDVLAVRKSIVRASRKLATAPAAEPAGTATAGHACSAGNALNATTYTPLLIPAPRAIRPIQCSHSVRCPRPESRCAKVYVRFHHQVTVAALRNDTTRAV